jgi:hypothetical protein
MVALDYFRRLGHDNHHRLFHVYGWEEKKSQASWGGSTVDHEKLAQAHIHSMTTAEMNRFIVTCALVSDLYCAGFSPGEALSKDSDLARTASRYKVDAAKIIADVEAALSAKRKSDKARRRLSKGAHERRSR